MRDFADQKEAVAEARRFLSAASNPAGPALTARRVVSINDRLFGRAISRDGRYMAFTDQSRDLGVYDIAAGEWRQILTRPNESTLVGNALISPDGRTVAYTLSTPPAGPDTYLVGADGSNPRRLPGAAADARRLPLAWFPDGTSLLVRVAVKGQVGQIAVVSSSDGSSTVVGTGSGVGGCFSPDGRYVALPVLSPKFEPDRIVIHAADGSGEASSLTGPYVLQLWVHDGTRLLVTKERGNSSDLWAVPMNAGKPSGIPTFVKEQSGGLLAASPSGEYYYATRSNSRTLYTVGLDPQTGKLTAGLTPISSGDRSLGSAWSPDGEWLAYYAFRENAQGSSRFAVVIRSSRTGEERELDGKSIAGSPSLRPQWFPDSRSLFVHKSDGSLHRFDVTTGESTPLLERVKIPPYSDQVPFPFSYRYVLLAPDGRAIYYLLRHADTNQTAIMRRGLDGEPETVVSRFSVNGIPGLSISPDGSRLVYVSGGPAGSLAPDGNRVFPDSTQGRSLWTVPATGGTPTLLYKDRSRRLHDPVWSPDGKQVFAFDYQAQGTVAMIPAGGGEPKVIDLQMTLMYYMAIHPNGRQIAVVDERINNHLWVMKNLFAVRRISK